MSVTAAFVGLLAGFGLGALAGWWSAHRRLGPGLGAVGAASRLPSPALDWLRRAHGAFGVWIAELDAEDGAPRAERIVDVDRLGVTAITAVDRRIERARDLEESGRERVEGGLLLVRAAAGTAVGLLLSADSGDAAVGRAATDLDRLLESVRQTPEAVAAAQAGSRDAAFESVGSLGLRLAYQLERMLTGTRVDADIEVVVAAHENPAVRIVGVSGHADRRLLDGKVPPESLLARVARGEVGETETVADPFGGLVADRREREGAAQLRPIVHDGTAVGAIVVFGDSTETRVSAELAEALANVAPRLAAALEAERRSHDREIDPLTGLLNRLGLEERVARHDLAQGALIYCDLDRFTSLNDTLGHSAGDAALLHVGGVIREQVRAYDIAARPGEEEFAIWLPQADVVLGLRVAERIRLKLESTPWMAEGRRRTLTASFGVAAGAAMGAEVEFARMMERAKMAVGRAKAGGRNRVEPAV